jgi:hypothetical protein
VEDGDNYIKGSFISRINNQQDASKFYFVTKLYMFRASLCPLSGVISCTRGNWYVSCRLCGHCLGQLGWNPIQQDASSIQNFILSRNSKRFGHLLCPSSRVISCTRGNWYVSCRLLPRQRPHNLH